MRSSIEHGVVTARGRAEAGRGGGRGGGDLGNGGHLNRDVADAEAGLGDPAALDGYVVPQPMVAVHKPATAATAVGKLHVKH